ncbi:hypothetical protein BGW80DRAFT_1344663 [Lactifluus volemus]|nr:hypothetical protein BGW80DRAFT_1344663 [Lactifluus volemus]
MSYPTVRLAFLLLLSGFAFAQSTKPPVPLPLPQVPRPIVSVLYPKCSPGWDWSFNSLRQNPCHMAALLLAECSPDGSYLVPALKPNQTYVNTREGAGPCMCNTVTYSLLSACGACQDRDYMDWAGWVYNCTEIVEPSIYPKPVPNDTCVPDWARLNPEVGGTWDEIGSMEAGRCPETCGGNTNRTCD